MNSLAPLLVPLGSQAVLSPLSSINRNEEQAPTSLNLFGFYSPNYENIVNSILVKMQV
ncbi:Hypothetical predicted protein [Cloeon dipterum]|uniref:Uncharacterized protein n=1 Tax=Cloeon dipterum TaxID=197152 RepID=A0A8S1C896_9INSE|nr:Hypothetical predicted protein [Cloeon dipterum]